MRKLILFVLLLLFLFGFRYDIDRHHTGHDKTNINYERPWGKNYDAKWLRSYESPWR